MRIYNVLKCSVLIISSIISACFASDLVKKSSSESIQFKLIADSILNCKVSGSSKIGLSIININEKVTVKVTEQPYLNIDIRGGAETDINIRGDFQNDNPSRKLINNSDYKNWKLHISLSPTALTSIEINKLTGQLVFKGIYGPKNISFSGFCSLPEDYFKKMYVSDFEKYDAGNVKICKKNYKKFIKASDLFGASRYLTKSCILKDYEACRIVGEILEKAGLKERANEYYDLGLLTADNSCKSGEKYACEEKCIIMANLKSSYNELSSCLRHSCSIDNKKSCEILQTVSLK